ncbi:serine/threonine-protein kinase [Streptomyces sp. PsTaAH-124]|uniref:serine/threonine-protein kinase n=1 Tax=Streptomyces sp. PsTaAH-124 TaxID=1157638 RepID=UPI000476E951|nr:serine/threonine-protein kinase [Streptomyces sp. PsTaAH-124]
MSPQRNIGAGAEAELPEYAGHYRLEARLGSGGMGVVHLARSTSGLRLAVKVVHAEFARDPEFRGRFRQEVAAARRVSGAFTASVVDADPEAGRPWMATLFIPGPTLAEEVKRNGPMAPARLRRLTAGLAEALRDIHRVGVVHRDLKPSNVLLAEDGPKVIDFGISRPKDSELRTETGKLIGTPPFMAPEQFRRPREVGPAADIFTLGSVLVHAATGRGPFDSDSPYVVAYQVVHDEPDLTGVPEDLAPLIRRCLAKEPEDRPTPDELMRELRSVAASYDTQLFVPGQRAGAQGAAGPEREPESEPGSAMGPAPDSVPHPAPAADQAGAGPADGAAGKPVRRPGRWPGRWMGRRLALVAGVCVLVVGSTLTAVELLGGGKEAAHGSDAPRTASAAFAGWQARPVAQGGGVPHCVSAAGRVVCAEPGLVFALAPADGTVLWRRPAAAAPVTGAPVVAGRLVVAPAGRDGVLRALDPATGEVRWQRDASAYRGMRFAGDTLLLTAADGTVTGVDAGSGAVRWSRRVPGLGLPSFISFAGDPLAYATGPGDGGKGTRVTAVDPRTGAVRWQARLAGTLRPFGSSGGSLFLQSVDGVYGDTRAVVRYSPGAGATREVALSVPLQQAHATVRGDVVHLLSAGGSLVAVDLAAGRQLWSLETSVSRGSAPVADARHVYVLSSDGRLLAVDARSGALVGQTPARLGAGGDRVASSVPDPVPVAGHVCGGAPDGTVFAVDARDPSAW